MGDPLTHPELEALVQICDEAQVRIFFVTNGVLLREKQSELLLHPAMRQVNFSLHSFYDNFPDRDPTMYLERIFSYTENAFIKRPDLYINYRLWNLQETRGTGAQNKEMLKRIEARFGVSIDPNVNVRHNKSIRVKNKLYLHFDTEFIWPDLKLPVLGDKGTCYGLTTHFGIHVDGTVVPCCLDKEAGIPLGNIKEMPLTTILANERSQQILNGFNKRRLVEPLCQRCQYIERFKG